MGMIMGCQPPEVSGQNVYQFTCDYKSAGGAKNIEVTQTSSQGKYSVKALSDDSNVPMSMSLSSASKGNLNNAKYYYDAPGSKNVSVKIDSQVGFTDIAGLRFKKEVVINVRNDGTVEVDREGIEAVSNKNGSTWISKKVTYQGKAAILMVKK